MCPPREKKLHNVTVYDYYIQEDEESDSEVESDDELLTISEQDSKIRNLESQLKEKDGEIKELKKLLEEYTPYKNKDEMEYHKSLKLSMLNTFHKLFKKRAIT